MSSTKDELRRKFLNQRKDFDLTSYNVKNKRVLQKVIKFTKNFAKKNDIIGIYWPLNGEADILELASNNDIITALPKIIPSGMIFVQYAFGDKIEPTKNIPKLKNLYQPISSIETIPKIIFLPGVAFCINGYRLGFGKGYYDKYLVSKSALTIGVCFQENLITKFPIESHDYKVNYLITDQDLIKC